MEKNSRFVNGKFVKTYHELDINHAGLKIQKVGSTVLVSHKWGHAKLCRYTPTCCRIYLCTNTNKEFLISKVCCFNSVLYEIKWLDVASAYKTREMTPHHSAMGYANAYGGSKSVWLAAKPIFNVRVFMKTLHRASFSTGASSTPAACSASGCPRAWSAWSLRQCGT